MVKEMRRHVDLLTGILLVGITCLVIFHEWHVAEWMAPVKPVLVVLTITILAAQERLARKAFVAVALGLTLALALSASDWQEAVLDGLRSAAFIAAFFSALSTLRNVAQTSPAVQAAGRFLSGQRPGRRYLALTLGGQGFALLLNYGAIQLLGALALANAGSEPNAEVRGHRIRRMLLAIQRAFVSTLPWSPLSFAMAISVSVVPGTSWAQAMVPGLISSVLLAGVGWGLDTAFKPSLSVTPQRQEPEGSWALMLPLLALLGILVISVIILSAITDVRIVGLVVVIVPGIALVWMIIQHWAHAPVRSVVRRVGDYVFKELPGYRGELTLLMMAGYIGTVGSALLGPLMQRAGLDLSVLPPWVILVAFVWIIPLAGQLGMNPILAVTLIAPLIPGADSLGVTPTAIVVALVAGWALSGASSPFTATTLLIGSFAGISALRVGWVWNGVYTLLCGVVLSIWVLLYAFVL
ncbi:H+/citrate symporter [Roseovarius sp. AK1035]|nr:H+/citrate symporter [Roseovarius sp. AK1035]